MRFGKDPPVLRHEADAEPGDAEGRQPGHVAAAQGDPARLRGGVSPMMLRTVVVLPAPLRPSRHTTSPASTVEREVEQDVAVAVVRVDVAELEQRHQDAAGCAEVHALHVGVGADLGGRALGDAPRPGAGP